MPVRFGALFGRAPATRALVDRLRQVARGEGTILLEGEAGAARARLAREIHRHSPRAQGPFVVVHCGKLSASELEPELFGDRPRLLALALPPRPDAFSRAHGGTLFLDEVSELPPHLQARLLRAVGQRQMHIVGSSQLRRIDVRVIASTERPLLERCRAGLFRTDLYYRLAVLPVTVPPERALRAELPGLVESILDEGVARHGQIDLARVLGSEWRSTVRELRSAVRRLVSEE